MTEALLLEDSVELGYALVARVAMDADVRALAIKGPVLALQSLRAPTTSVDVDFLVAPGEWGSMQEALGAVGWLDRGLYDTPRVVPQHSATHLHTLWPNEIDVHWWFPGFLADPAAVFEVLWSRRVSVTVAHAPVWAPDPVAHAAIAGLHYLRDGSTGWAQAHLANLAARIRTWDPELRRDFAELASRTGSAETLRPLLTAVSAPETSSTAALAVSIADWRLRSESSAQQVVPWLLELQRLPWYRRPAFAARAVWLGERHFKSRADDSHMSRRELLRARWRRLRRGLRALPAARAELRRAGRWGGRRAKR